MNSILKSVFTTSKSNPKNGGESTPKLNSSHSEPHKKSAGGLKKLAIKLNGKLSIGLQIPVDRAAELTCWWLLEETRKKFTESSKDKYHSEISRIVGLQTADGLLSLDYWLTQPENTLEVLPDKLNLLAIVSTGSERTPGVRRVSLQDFELCGSLGGGAFAMVYLARKKQDGKFYAIKQIKKGSLNQKEIERLIDERDIMRMGRENGSVELFYAFQTDDYCYFVMQYCPGGDLFKLMQAMGGPLTEKEAKYYTKSVLENIKGLHAKGILYRDLKAENLLLDLDGNVYLADFGMSKLIEDPNLNYIICGTPEFYAPELLRGEGYSFAVDYYNVGTLAYELVTCQPPYPSRKDLTSLYKDILTKEIKIPSHFSSELQDFLKKLLVKDPKKRLGSNGIDEILKHPWLADASNISLIQISYTSIQKSVKKIDREADKGILIDSKNWFNQQSKKKLSNRIAGFSIHSFKDFDRDGEEESPMLKLELRSAKDSTKSSQLSVVTESTGIKGEDSSYQKSLAGIPSITNDLTDIPQSCDFDDAEKEGQTVESSQLKQYIFDPQSSVISNKQ